MITTKRPTKFFAMITYVVALICIVLGFFYPFGTVQGTNGMIAMQLPAVIDTLFGTSLNMGAAYSFPTVSITLFGIEAIAIGNVYAILILAYAVVAILGLLALIPICVSNRYNQTAKVWANVIEILALIVLSLYVFSDVARLLDLTGATDITFTNWTPYIAFAGVGIVYIIQNIATKGSSGVIKSLLFIFASLSMYALLGLYGAVTQFADIFTTLNNSLGSVSALFSVNALESTGLDLGYRLFAGTLFGTNGYLASMEAQGTGVLISLYLSLAVCILVTLNFFLDMFGIAKKTNKGMLICNLVRYGLLLIVAVTLAIMAVVIDGGKIGLMLYVIAIATLIAVLINVARFVKRIKSGKTVKTATADLGTDSSYDLYGDNLYEQLEGDTQPVAPIAPVAAQPVQTYQAPAAVETPAPAYIPPIAPIAAQPRQTQVQTTEFQQVYNISSVYSGPTDNFIKKLSNDEKIEFAKVFLERRYGPLSVIPTYNFGEDNKKFFSAIFIYISRVREYLSDGLMNKIYEELNLLRQ